MLALYNETMNYSPLVEIGILMGVATIISFIMRLLRQPLIIGHIITGILMGQFAVGIFYNNETLELFSHLGIAFLLFSVGLNLNPRLLKKYGVASVLNTLGQVVLTGGAGVVFSLLLGFDWITALYVGVAIAFSSTVIVLKLLADKGDLDKLYVKISIGSLLLQDLIAILLLFALPIVTGASGNGQNILLTLTLGGMAGVGVFAFAHYVIGYLHPYLSRSQELLFLFANAWAICISIIFLKLGFSLEGGALIAGVALSNLKSTHEISARLTPLRDFFIVAFFILLGSRLVVSNFSEILFPALALSAFVLVINPLIQLVVMGILGYKRKTSFQTGMMAAQISEFSLILISLGVSLNQVDENVLSIVTFVGIITIFISTYLIYYSDVLYRYFAPYLGIFERVDVREKGVRLKKFPLILIGGGRMSYEFVKRFTKDSSSFLLIDHDLDIIKKFEKEGISCEYGDVGDPDFIEDLNLEHTTHVISTASDFETNRVVIGVVKRKNSATTVWVVSHEMSIALKLYEAGADYVIVPHFLGSSYAARLFGQLDKGEIDMSEVKLKHIKQLQRRSFSSI